MAAAYKLDDENNDVIAIRFLFPIALDLKERSKRNLTYLTKYGSNAACSVLEQSCCPFGEDAQP